MGVGYPRAFPSMPAQTLSRRLATATRWPRRRRAHGVALHVAHDAALPQRGGGVRGARTRRRHCPTESTAAGCRRRSTAPARSITAATRWRSAPRSVSAAELLGRVAADPDRAAPSEFATFKKTRGEEGAMAVGRRVPGAHAGTVGRAGAGRRASERRAFGWPRSKGTWRLGRSRSRARAARRSDRVLIESWARGGDRLSNLLYDRLRFSKEVQFHMWTSFLERVVKLSGGKRDGGLRIHTRRAESARRPALGRPARAGEAATRCTTLVQLGAAVAPRRGRAGGLEGRRLPPAAAARGARGARSPEAPGSAPGELMEDYEFADPRIVRALYAPDSALEGRDMLLEARFWGLRIPLRGARRRRLSTSATGARRAVGAGVGLELPHAPGPPRDGADGLRACGSGSTTARSSSASTSSRARPASPNPVDAAGVPAVRPRAAGRGSPRRACARMAERLNDHRLDRRSRAG